MLRQRGTLVVCMAALMLGNMSEMLASEDSDGGRRHLIFNNHPKLRKLFKLGALGAATGGVGAAVLGRGVGSGMVTGAGTKVGMHAAKKKLKKDDKETD
jgi:hypothetical protein